MEQGTTQRGCIARVLCEGVNIRGESSVRRAAICMLLRVVVLPIAVASPIRGDIVPTTSVQRSTQVSSGRQLEFLDDSCEEIHARSWEPLRIGFEVVDGVDVASETQEFVRDLVQTAADYWMDTLQVHRHAEPLRLDREGSSAPMCGKFTIPDEYLYGYRNCSQRCTWYSSADGTHGSNCTCLSSGVTGVLDMSYNGSGICEACTETSDGTGADYDLYLFVGFSACDVEAYAGPCLLDQCGRPIFGYVVFCWSTIPVHPLVTTPDLVGLTVHELAHVLGFISHLFRYFRESDGTPKVTGDPVPWSCSDYLNYEYPDTAGGRSDVDLSTAGLVEVFNERGVGPCTCPMNGTTTMSSAANSSCIVPVAGLFTAPGGVWRTPTCVTKLITPKVLEKAREHFGCPTLNGAELENQELAGCQIVGSHWEQRIFVNEVMSPVVIYGGVHGLFVSEVTLALFEDSGWYLPNYSNADTLIEDMHWGYHQGCSFATEKCVENGVTDFGKFWCTEAGAYSCSVDHTEIVACAMDRYDDASDGIKSWNYFSGNTSLGPLSTVDYCPMAVLTKRVCTLSANSTSYDFDTYYDMSNSFHEVLGLNSRCFDSTLRDNVSNSLEDDITRQLCYEVDCNSDKSAYTIKIEGSASTEGTVDLGTCYDDGQILSSPGYLGAVTCVKPSIVCGWSPKYFAYMPTPVSPTPPSTTVTVTTTSTTSTSSTTPTTTTTVTIVTTTTTEELTSVSVPAVSLLVSQLVVVLLWRL